jgi:hypothetical protein
VSDTHVPIEHAFAPMQAAHIVELLDRIDELRVRLEAIESGSDRDWLTLVEAAEREGCSYDAMRMRVERGRYERKNVGARIMVAARSLDPPKGRR